MANLPLAFAELLAGGVIIAAGVSDPKGSIANVIKGEAKGIASFNTGSAAAAPSASVARSGSASSSSYVNPLPGATASRVDQGVDYTSQSFVAPGASKILVADQSNGGWGGGGYVAGQLLNGPYAGKVWYMAEGLSPSVSAGDTVTPGQTVATPVASPYNQIVGNIEAGWANPSSPTQPLAQISSDRSAVALSWNRFVQALGGPLSTITENAGYP